MLCCRKFVILTSAFTTFYSRLVWAVTCAKHVQSSLVLAGFDTLLVGRACTMISNIFFSLMVAEKCFMTRYAVKFVNMICYTFDRIFCSPGIVKLCPVSGSTHLGTFHIRRHLCFDGLKASRTFAIGLNSGIPRFASHARHLCFDRCEVSLFLSESRS